MQSMDDYLKEWENGTGVKQGYYKMQIVALFIFDYS